MLRSGPGVDPGELNPTVVRGAVVRIERASAAGLAEALGALAAAAKDAAVGPLDVVTLSELVPDMGRDRGEVLPLA